MKRPFLGSLEEERFVVVREMVLDDVDTDAERPASRRICGVRRGAYPGARWRMARKSSGLSSLLLVISIVLRDAITRSLPYGDIRNATETAVERHRAAP